MKKRFKGIQIFLAIAISFSIPVFSAYSNYYILMEADFLRTILNYENPDQENLLTNCRKELNVFGPEQFFTQLPIETDPLKKFFNCSFQTHSLDQQVLILRC